MGESEGLLFAGVLRNSMKVSCMVMAASKEEEPSLTDALTRVAQPRCLRSEKHVCSPILLTQTQQGLFALTLRSGLGPPGYSLGILVMQASEFLFYLIIENKLVSISVTTQEVLINTTKTFS